MGLFKTKVTVSNVADPLRREEIELWVDTGAYCSWISRSRLEALGIKPTGRRQFRTIENRVIERDMAAVFMSHDGQTSADNVAMAEPGDAEVLGAMTLEALMVAADPVQKRLLPIPVLQAFNAEVKS